MSDPKSSARAEILKRVGSTAKPRAYDIVGSTGLRQFGGFVDEEFLARLRGLQGARFYRQMMDNSSVLGAIFFIVKSLVRQAPCMIEAADDSVEAEREKVFIEECLKDMSHTFEDFISEALSFLGFGWSYFEQIYKLRKGDTNDPSTRSQYTDGRIGLRRLDIRSQDTLWKWEFDEDDSGCRGLWQMDPYAGKGTVFIPIEKSLLFRTETTKGNPEGRSLLRNSVRDYHYLTRIQEIEAIGIERDLAGMPVMEVPKELLLANAEPGDAALRTMLERMIQQVRVDERFGGLVPAEDNGDGTKSGFRFKLLSTGGRRAIDTNAIIKRYESRMAMTFLCEFIMIGQEKVGTQSLFQGKSNLFGVALGTMLGILSSTFNRFCIGRLMEMNRVPREIWPELKFGDVVSPDLDKIGTFVTAMGAAGLLSPNKPLENKLLGMASLPPPDEEDLEIYDDPTQPTPAEGPDMAAGLLSERQITAVININNAITTGKMDRGPGLELLASALGMDTGSAARYLSAPKADPTRATPGAPAGESAPPGAPLDSKE